MNIIVRFILAIFLPPLAVFLNSGISSAFVINILLTLLGWVPGIIHAVWVLQKTEERRNEVY
ncbi:YqaE/Pmp3 family membrane protein [Phormidesmis priestleyi ULC007]|uniref:YqaE/Pmp3 family membrane protein n=1 Tax=Phormidesmis priestleyi ULC007 TaxID=1920490 RepID=A0A2T1D632_9CYAN|nr:YqaE/Pmp3 family membrane protein [Phormidesmis priestleyi]PSB15948.1 YqaE/Pmp3 family membrane protein [Phormidesmis priestleyi ULC007]PZO49837.1 MAG: YqaE/Pmp3 family membrane protein [Phormidesmis priestleyi]